MTIPDSQLRYGSVITLQNGYESYQGGYLYTSGRARTPWSLWDVSTSKDAVDGIKGSTFWRIMSAENKTPGEKVCYGDVLIL